MRIAEVMGTVTLSRCHPSFVGARLRLAVPLALEDLESGQTPQGVPVVLWDELNAGLGSRIALSEGPEAAQPFRPEIKPIDAYNAALLDDVHVDASLLEPPE